MCSHGYLQIVILCHLIITDHLQVADSVGVDYLVTDQSHHVYRVSGEEIIVGFVTVDTKAEEDIVKDIMEHVLITNDDISFIAAFQPSSK